MNNKPMLYILIPVCIIGAFISIHVILWLFWICVSLTIPLKKEYDKPSKFYNWAFVLWYRYIIKVARIKLYVTGYEKIPFGTRFLLVSNHCSKFDNFIQCAVLKKTQMAYVSKPENFKIPIGRHFLRRGLYIPIVRGNPRQGLEAILRGIDLIKQNKVSVGIYPEGTRSQDGVIQEFKPGAFKIAEKARCPVVVVSMSGTENISKNFPWKKTVVHMDILDVIQPDVWDNKSTVEVSQYSHDLIAKKLGMLEEKVS